MIFHSPCIHEGNDAAEEEKEDDDDDDYSVILSDLLAT